MSEKRRGLGRGLGALIPTAPVRPADTSSAGDSTPTTPAAGSAGSDLPASGEGASPASDRASAPSDAEGSAATGTSDVQGTSAGVVEGRGVPSVAQPTSAAPRSSLGGVDVLIPARPVSGSVAGSLAWGETGTADLRSPNGTGADGAQGDSEPVDARGIADGAGQSASSTNGVQPVPGAHFAELPVASITPNPRQPRQVFDEEAMAELVHSLREVGLLQPVVVRPVGEDRYELIMGERRWRAAQEAGFEVIPAIVRSTADDDLLRDALLENLHRSQLNPLEEAAAYGQLLEDFGCTHEELATRIGRSRPQISNTLRLLKLPPLVQRRVAAGVLSAGHARALLGLPDGGAQERLAQRIVAEGLSVRAVEEIVALGGDEAPAEPVQRPRGRKPVAPALADLADRLADRFETRVKVDLGRTKGKITVEFASIQDLERIVALMTGPDGVADAGAGVDAGAHTAPEDGASDHVSRETEAIPAGD